MISVRNNGFWVSRTRSEGLAATHAGVPPWVCTSGVGSLWGGREGGRRMCWAGVKVHRAAVWPHKSRVTGYKWLQTLNWSVIQILYDDIDSQGKACRAGSLWSDSTDNPFEMDSEPLRPTGRPRMVPGGLWEIHARQQLPSPSPWIRRPGMRKMSPVSQRTQIRSQNSWSSDVSSISCTCLNLCL